MDEQWFRLEGASHDGAAALRFLLRELELVWDGDQHAWRWVTIGAHQALQDFLSAATPGDLWVAQPKLAAKFIRGMEEGIPGSELPELRVDHFRGLFSRVKEYTGWQPSADIEGLLVGGGDSDQPLDLNDLRNGMIHRLGAWSIEIGLIVERVLAALEVMEHLGWRQRYTNHVFWGIEVDADAAWSDLTACRRLLEGLRHEN